MKYRKLLYLVGAISLMATGCIAKSSARVASTIKQSLEYMYEEERLAKEVYLAIYNRQPVFQLYRIATNSETRHINAVKNLASRYGVRLYTQRPGRYKNPHIQALYNKLYAKGVRSKRDALEVGCMVEVTDIDDLNRYIKDAKRVGASDVVQTYEFLRRGSYNHYWAFDRGLKRLGVSSGCCALGSKYCHPEYPKNQRGQGQRRGRGHGMGYGHGRGMGHGMGGGPWR